MESADAMRLAAGLAGLTLFAFAHDALGLAMVTRLRK